MSELKRYILPLVIGISIILIVGIAAWTSGYVAETGTLGDTLGGIFSPVIGLVSAILIYETFKAQREQLQDQRNANLHNRSAFFYDELKQLFDNAQDQLNHFSFVTPTPNMLQFSKLEAVQNFISFYEREDSRRINDSGLRLIHSIISQLRSTLYVAQKATLSSGLLTDEDLSSLMHNYLSSLINSHILIYEPVFDVVRARLYYARQDKVDEDKPFSELNTLIDYFQAYYNIMESLADLGYVQKYVPVNLSFEEFYDDPLNSSALNIIDLKSRFQFVFSSNY